MPAATIKTVGIGGRGGRGVPCRTISSNAALWQGKLRLDGEVCVSVCVTQ